LACLLATPPYSVPIPCPSHTSRLFQITECSPVDGDASIDAQLAAGARDIPSDLDLAHPAAWLPPSPSALSPLFLVLIVSQQKGFRLCKFSLNSKDILFCRIVLSNSKTYTFMSKWFCTPNLMLQNLCLCLCQFQRAAIETRNPRNN